MWEFSQHHKQTVSQKKTFLHLVRINHVRALTANFADVEHVADDAIGDLYGWLGPGKLQGGVGEGGGAQALRRVRQVFSQWHGQAGTGLVGTGAVLSDALVDGFIFWGDAGYSERAREGIRNKMETDT